MIKYTIVICLFVVINISSLSAAPKPTYYIPCPNSQPNICRQISVTIIDADNAIVSLMLDRKELEQYAMTEAQRIEQDLPSDLRSEFNWGNFKYLNGRVTIDGVNVTLSNQFHLDFNGTYIKDRKKFAIPCLCFQDDGWQDVATFTINGTLDALIAPFTSLPQQLAIFEYVQQSVSGTYNVIAPGQTFSFNLNKPPLTFSIKLVTPDTVAAHPELATLAARSIKVSSIYGHSVFVDMSLVTAPHLLNVNTELIDNFVQLVASPLSLPAIGDKIVAAIWKSVVDECSDNMACRSKEGDALSSLITALTEKKWKGGVNNYPSSVAFGCLLDPDVNKKRNTHEFWQATYQCFRNEHKK